MLPPVDSLKLSLIKIDVEGWELPVLRSGQALLEQHQFPPILFEAWHTDFFVQQKQELLDFIQSLGYEISYLGGMDYLAQHPLFPRKLHFKTDENQQLSVSLEIKV